MKSKMYVRRLLSLIIASVMIVTMLPVSAFAADAADVMIEDQAETIVENAEDVSGEVVEETAEVPDVEESADAAALDEADGVLPETDSEELTGVTDILSVTVEGTLSGSEMHYDAQLTGLSVSAVVPVKRTAEGSYMTADIIDVSAYEGAVAKMNYGKILSGMYGLELHFYDKKDKEITHLNTSDITVNINGLHADSYFIGSVEKKVKAIQRGTEPTFTLQVKKVAVYLIAGLVDDGVSRAFAETDEYGNKRFNMNDESVNIEVIAPEDAFADGVSMEASDMTNGSVQDTEDADEELVGASEDEYVAAFEISFYNEEGDEQQPKEDVTVKIATPLDMSKTYKLIHISDDGVKSEVENAVFTEDGVEFVTDSFSVYAIKSEEQTTIYRRTYKFTTDGSTPFWFYNKNGELVDNQIIKNEDVLEEVGIPYESGKEFTNWIVSAVSEDETALAVDDVVTLGDTITNVCNADTTVTLKPAYGNLYYVTFHEYESGANPDVVQTIKIVSEGESVVIGDIVAPNKSENILFYGWKDGNTEYPVYSNGVMVPTTAIQNVRANKDLYPIFETAHWLRFVSGETGSRAEYVPSRFVLENEGIRTLPEPTRKGYTFAGWYTGSMSDDGKILYGDQVSNENGTVTNPSTGLRLTADTTLYAQWLPVDNASYTVIIWRQKVSDDKNASDEEKTYDYAEHYVRSGETDSEAAPSNADKTKSGGDYTGFHYARTVQNSRFINSDDSTVINVYYDRDLKAINFYYRQGDAPAGAQPAYTYTRVNNPNTNSTSYYGVLEDGSYVPVRHRTVSSTEEYYAYRTGALGIYNYHRYNGTFYVRRGILDYVSTNYNGSNLPPAGDNTTYYTEWLIPAGLAVAGHQQLYPRTRTINSSQWYVYATGETYTGDLFTRSTMSGYPQMVTWTGLFGQSFEQNGYVWPDAIRWNEDRNDDGTTQTFLAAFEVEENPYNLYDQGSPGNYTIYHYIQGLDGKYSQVDNVGRFTAKSSGGKFTFQNKFKGFEVSTYSSGSNGFSENGGNNPATGSVSNYKNPLHVYHTRNKWKITFMSDGLEVTESDELYYQASMEAWNLSLEQAGLTEKPHEAFTGWYSDVTCTQPFSFNDPKGMPDANVIVYAGWEPQWYQVIVDPNGGIITPDIGATYMWKQYEEKIARYEIVRTYIEDENGTYKYVYKDGREDPDGNDPVRTATYVPAEEGYTGTKYRPIDINDPAYVLVGWYVVDENDNMTETPYDFDLIIDHPLTIRAKWRITGEYQIVYDAANEVEVDVDGEPQTFQVSGTVANSDAKYADGSRVIIQGAPTDVTAQFRFDGWYVADTDGSVLDDNGGSYYAPGDALILDAAAWSRDKIITLKAHYTNVVHSTEPIQVTKLVLDANGGTFANISSTAADAIPSIAVAADNTKVTITKLHLNDAVELEGYSDKVSQEYYTLLGWSTDPSAAVAQFGPDDIVGADNRPDESNTLYAVWEHKYFYIFHSSTGDLEAVPLGEATVNLKEHVADGNYGGYFTSYGGYTVTGEDKAAAVAATKGATPAAAHVTGNTYDGKNLSISGKRYWTKAQAGTTASGESIAPTEGAVYYLKEVPNKYLATNARWAYQYSKVTTSNKITALYLLTCIDDTNFTETGFIIETRHKGKVVNKFSYKKKNQNGTTSTTLISAADLLGENERGYIGVVEASADILEALDDGDRVSVQPYWETLDGVEVTTNGYTFYKEGSGDLSNENLKYVANT